MMSQARRQERSTEVVVIGAGLAGLTAARELLAAGIEPLVLEARERVGGRTYTRPAGDGTLLDLGGQWIGPTQERVAALAKAVGATTFPTYDSGQNIEYRAGQRNYYTGAVPTYDPLASMDVIEAMLEINILASEVPLEAPWLAPRAAEWDAQTMASWMEANVSSEYSRWLMTLAVEAVFSAEPRDISLLHVLFYVHSGGSLNQLVSVAGGAQELRFHQGAQFLSERVAQALGPERVLLGSPVYVIEQDERGVRVESERFEVTAQRAIIAIPPTLAGRLRYRPALPALRDQLTQRVPMGTVLKVQCLYPEPFWRSAGFSGQIASDSGPVRITFDNTPESGAPGVLMGFIEGDEGRIWGSRSFEERRLAVLDCLASHFGDQAANPLEYVEQNWAEEEYSRGCYAGYMPTGVWTMYGQALREPQGRLHWAGTETATVWNGYMDGAVQSGERAAEEVRAALKDLPA